ncbi:MAG: YncE family protein [Candidatus Eremiobacteraeota bacterium]|nr:YncE family protein [Candidatus Eremiobacteraeota bacterium]
MPIVQAAPPQRVPLTGGFDYVTVDSVRRRVYAAHSGNRALLVVDADTDKLIGQVRIGPMAGVAFNPQTGRVFTGNSLARSVSEIDSMSLKELRSVDLPGAIDAIAYDESNDRIYGDEDDGTHIYVVDAKTFKQIGAIDLPGHKPEYLAVDPDTHDVYQNIDDRSEVVVIDPRTLTVRRTIATPEIKHNHPLQYDPYYKHIIVAGSNGVLSVYDPTGKRLSSVAVPERIDQCSLDPGRHLLACAGSGKITLVREDAQGEASTAGQIDVPRGMHTLAIDAKTGDIWGVWASDQGDFIQRFSVKP